jgi:hypothetical protein
LFAGKAGLTRLLVIKTDISRFRHSREQVDIHFARKNAFSSRLLPDDRNAWEKFAPMISPAYIAVFIHPSI